MSDTHTEREREGEAKRMVSNSRAVEQVEDEDRREERGERRKE